MSTKRKSGTEEKGISTIYAKTNSEYFPRKTSSTSSNDADALRSAHLLDNVVMYLNYQEPDRRSSKMSSVKVTGSSVTPTPTNAEVESVIETVITPDNFQQDLLSGKEVKERLLNEVATLYENKIRWFHCVTRSTFRSLLESIDLSFSTMNILLSSTPKSNILRQSDGSIVIVLVSLTLDDDRNVNMDQVAIYIRDNFIISFECLTSGNVIPDNVNQLVKQTPFSGSVERTLDDTAKFEEFDQTLSREFYLRTFICEFSQSHFFFSEMREKLRKKYTRIHKGSRSANTSNPKAINPRTFSSFRSSSNITSCPLDVSYFIYESIRCMLHISTPVLNIYISHGKALSNDLTFTSWHTTTRSIENKEQIKILRSGLNLISNLIERTLLCLQDKTPLLQQLLSLRPEYIIEILDDYKVIFHLVQKLQENLEQLNYKIINYEKKKTDQIKIALSMVSVLFFPIGFLASVFGQNFTHSNNGIINWMYNSHSGIYIFITLNLFIFLFTILTIYFKGWGETLGELHVVGKVFIQQFDWWNRLFPQNGIHLSKSEIETMISSRKGTKSNRLAMHVNAKRYQRTGASSGGGAGGGDRLRNFSV
jgi:Mg2+ and Co2+ transporter CorA